MNSALASLVGSFRVASCWRFAGMQNRFLDELTAGWFTHNRSACPLATHEVRTQVHTHTHTNTTGLYFSLLF